MITIKTRYGQKEGTIPPAPAAIPKRKTDLLRP